MNAREKKRLSHQLVDQASALIQQDDPALGLSMASVSAAMLKVAGSTAEKMNPHDFDALYAQYFRVGQEVEAFFHAAEGRFHTEADSDSCRATLENLKEGREAAEKIRREIAQAAQDREKVEEELHQAQEELKKLQEDMSSAEDDRDSLQKLMEGCSREKIAAQLAENEALTVAFNAASTELRGLKAQHEETTQKLTQVNAEIAALPEENHQLLEKFEEASALLQRLEEVHVTCSPERQAELQQQIETLSPEVEENQQATQILTDRLADLNEQYVQYDQQRQTLSTNVLELLEKKLGDLSRALTDHENRLGQISEQARQLTDRLADCMETRRRCQDWLDADITPLEAMIAAVGRPEAKTLCQTLDPGSLDEVRQLQSEVRVRLQRLDDILNRCAAAVHLDQESVEKRARR